MGKEKRKKGCESRKVRKDMEDLQSIEMLDDSIPEQAIKKKKLMKAIRDKERKRNQRMRGACTDFVLQPQRHYYYQEGGEASTSSSAVAWADTPRYLPGSSGGSSSGSSVSGSSVSGTTIAIIHPY